MCVCLSSFVGGLCLCVLWTVMSVCFVGGCVLCVWGGCVGVASVGLVLCFCGGFVSDSVFCVGLVLCCFCGEVVYVFL